MILTIIAGGRQAFPGQAVRRSFRDLRARPATIHIRDNQERAEKNVLRHGRNSVCDDWDKALLRGICG
jgi:hypothetical protein